MLVECDELETAHLTLRNTAGLLCGGEIHMYTEQEGGREGGREGDEKEGGGKGGGEREGGEKREYQLCSYCFQHECAL